MERTWPGPASVRREHARLVRRHRRAHSRQELPLVCEREALQASPGPGGVPKEEEKAVTTVLSAPYNIPLYELRRPIQFESKETSQTNDVIVAIDHWSLWEQV